MTPLRSVVRLVVSLTLVAAAVALVSWLATSETLSFSGYLSDFNTRYGTSGTRLDDCTTCHLPDFSAKNPYGAAIQGASGATFDDRLAAVESLDSDGDGWTNVEEINSLTFPGDAADFPPPTPTDVSVFSATTTAPANGAVGVAFDVTADVAVSNLSGQDPVDVDTTIQLNLPPDCTTADTNPVIDENRSISQAGSPVSIPQQSWSVTCAGPSNHDFTTTATAAIDDPGASESDNANNTLASAASTTAVTADADLGVQGVAVSGPPSPRTGTAFDVSADVTLINNGPFGPADADTTVTLNLPEDCSTQTANPQTVQNTSVPTTGTTSVPTLTWSVTCTLRSDHTFSADAGVVPDDVHVNDTNVSNDTGQSPATNIELFDEADVAVTGVTVIAPAVDQSVGTAFAVTADVELSNLSGADPVNADTTITLSLPADCSTGDTNPVVVQDTSVSQAASPVSLAQQSWSVTCTQPSNHVFTVDVSTTIDQLHVADSDGANDSGAGQDTVAVTADADIEVVSVSLSVPAGITATTAFNISVDASLVNNGPFGPVNVDAVVTLTLPADCTSVPSGPQNVGDMPLAVGVQTDIAQQSWSVTCSGDGSHDFSAEVVVTVDQPHVSDADAGNDSSDTAVLDVVIGPAPAPSPTPTPTPTASPAPSPSPSPGPTGLPSTGGGPLDDAGISWLAFAVLVALVGGGLSAWILWWAGRPAR